MRAVHFMKIDYVTARQMMYLTPIFYGVAFLLGMHMESMTFAYAYMMFIALIFSTGPFGVSTKKEAGFLILLPSTVRDRVAGRFLFGISCIGASMVCCVLFTAVYHLLGHPATAWTVAAILVSLAVSVFLMTVEFLVFYLCGAGKFNGQYLSNIVRTLPGMAMFFLLSYAIGRVEDAQLDGAALLQIGERLLGVSVFAVAASLAILCAAMVLCVKVIEKRDYV